MLKKFNQDSMHFFEGIKAEWQIVESNIELNGMVIFDNLKLKGVKALEIGLNQNTKINIHILK